MNCYRGSREEFTDTVPATKESERMRKLINNNCNKRILNLILHGKINAGRSIKKYTVLTEGNTTGHCQNP